MSLHFSKQEFLSRKSRVIDSMKEQNIDALLMFKQESMYWLTGYDSFGFVFFQTLILKNDGEKQIMWFLSPAEDKGVAFLKIEHDNKNDEMKIWLPAFDRVKRIAARKRSDNFMGSDMSYEDMSSRQLNEYIFTQTLA